MGTYFYDKLSQVEKERVDSGIFWLREKQPGHVLGELGFRADSEWCIFCGQPFAIRLPMKIQGQEFNQIHMSICEDCLTQISERGGEQ